MKLTHTCTFSIIIPTYNAESYIARCLESCINQTFSDIEILVVDDCGSDDSIKIAQSYIIIPTYNAESYIARCLESCINQTFSDIEILVVDDCGSDDSIKIAQSYADRDSRIRIIQNPHNLGLFAARISGEKEARGAYILPLDADDYISPFTCKTLYRKAYSIASALDSLILFAHKRDNQKNYDYGGGDI